MTDVKIRDLSQNIPSNEMTANQQIAVEDKKIPDNEKWWFLGALAVVFVVVVILRIKENQ